MTVAILASQSCAIQAIPAHPENGSNAERLSRWRRGQETKRGRMRRRIARATDDSSLCSRRATLQATTANPENDNNLHRGRRRALCDSNGRRLHYQRWVRSSDRSSRRPILQSQPPPRKARRLSGVVAALRRQLVARQMEPLLEEGENSNRLDIWNNLGLDIGNETSEDAINYANK